MVNLNFKNPINKISEAKNRSNKLAILSTALLVTLGAYNSNANTINDTKEFGIEETIDLGYLDSLDKLDNNIELKDFITIRNEIKKTFPSVFNTNEEEDKFYKSVYFELYDLSNKFIDPKVKNKIKKLMEEHNPLFNKYNNFYEVGDKIIESLEDNKNLSDEEAIIIEDFFSKKGFQENGIITNTDGVSWGSLKETLQDKIIQALKEEINNKNISNKELEDFKVIMNETRGVFSNLRNQLN